MASPSNTRAPPHAASSSSQAPSDSISISASITGGSLPSPSPTELSSPVSAAHHTHEPTPVVPHRSSSVTFTQGPYNGMHLRAELSELQAGKIGRKSGMKDRRVVDPPPVLELKLFNVNSNPALDFDTDSAPDDEDSPPDEETEVDYFSFFHRGLVAHIDVYQVPGTVTDLPVVPGPARHTQLDIGDNNLEHAEDVPPHVIAHVGEHEITDDDRCTDMLLGATFIHAASVSYRQGVAFMFPFADVSMKSEGVFLPHYRCFEVISQSSGKQERSVLAECLGKPFRIYSTKGCPRLPPSTELTQVLVRAGIRVNARVNERRRRFPKRPAPKSDAEADGEDEDEQRYDDDDSENGDFGVDVDE